MAKQTKKPAKKKVVNPAPFRKNPVIETGKLDIASEAIQQMELTDIVPTELESLVNPLGVTEQWRAVCKTCHIFLSPAWRDSHEAADADALPHVPLQHRIGYVNRFIRTV